MLLGWTLFPDCTIGPLPVVRPLGLKGELLEWEHWHFTKSGWQDGLVGGVCVCVQVRGWGQSLNTTQGCDPKEKTVLGEPCPTAVSLCLNIKQEVSRNVPETWHFSRPILSGLSFLCLVCFWTSGKVGVSQVPPRPRGLGERRWRQSSPSSRAFSGGKWESRTCQFQRVHFL